MKADIKTCEHTILKKPAPLMLIDTCSLLDVIRIPYRINAKLSHLKGAQKIIEKCISRDLYVVITDTIENEYINHKEELIIELERFFNKLIQSNEKVINTIESVGLRYDIDLKDNDRIQLGSALKNISDNIVNQSIIITKDSNCIQKANARVELYRTPSQRGKSESKDCVIIEHFLDLSRQLRSMHYNEKIIFITSNSNDYGCAPDAKMPLDSEFMESHIQYCNNFDWAMSKI